MEAMALGLWTMRVLVSAQIWISSSVSSVAWERRASGPRMPSSSWANFTVPLACPSWVNRRPYSLERSLVAWVRLTRSWKSASRKLAILRVMGGKHHGDVDPAVALAVPSVDEGLP